MARRDALERLGRRGIVAFRVDGVLGRLTQRQSMASRPQIVALADLVKAGAVMAAAIRKRVQGNGDLGDQAFPGYSRKSWSNFFGGKLAASYVLAAGGKLTKVHFPARGAVPAHDVDVPMYESSDVFHRNIGTKPGSYSVTGGMWKGLQARGSGKNAVILDFAGSSMGSGGAVLVKVWHPRQRRVKLMALYESANVRNGWKSGAIYDKHGVHILKPTEQELTGFGRQVSAHVDKWLQLRLTVG